MEFNARNIIFSTFLVLILLLSGCTKGRPDASLNVGDSAPTAHETVPNESYEQDDGEQTNTTPPETESEPEPEPEPETETADEHETEPESEPAEPAPPEEEIGIAYEDITFNSVAWKIHGTLYPSTTSLPKNAIILVPMLGKTHESYPNDFIFRLHEEFPDTAVLTMDLRGHGQSTNLGTYESFSTETYLDMKSDVLNAKKFLHNRYPTIKQYHVIGASIGSTAALLAANQDSDIYKVIMISPGMEYKDVDIHDAVVDYIDPLLVLASTGDDYSYDSARTIMVLTTSSQTESQYYSGSAHGTDMFGATDEPISNKIIDFLK